LCCSGGDVASIIKNHQRTGTFADEDFVWKILGEVSSALEQCHKCGSGVILHRDLKPANIFLDNPQTKCVKLGDFGLARTLKNSFDMAQTHVGTPYYMSPEQVLGLQYNGKSDIWSLGCLVYELAALSPPFRASSQLVLEKKIRAGSFDRIPRQYSAELERVIRSMIQVEQSKRPSVEDVIRAVSERQNRVQRDLVEATHRRRNSLTAIAASAITVNLQLAQREAELAAQLAAVQKREDDVARREAAVLARERRLQEKEAQCDMREAMQQAAVKNTYRVPLSNLANYISQPR
jgi:serine/threonine protein kinase